MLGGTGLQRSEFAPDTCCWLACVPGLYNLRKKLPILAWTPRQVGCRHTFMSVSVRPFCVVLTGLRIPGSWRHPRRALRGDFLSGLVGLWTRTPRLRRRDGISLQRIPATQTGAEPRRAIGLETVRERGATLWVERSRLSGKTTGMGYWLRPTARSANGVG